MTFKPTSTNKRTFKAFLRTYKDEFSSNVLKSDFSEISGMLWGYHNSLTSDTSVDVLTFDYNDTIDVTNTNNLIYIPGLENDVINLTNGSTTKSVKILSNGVEVDSTTYTLGQYFDIGSQTYIVWGLGGALLNAQSVSQSSNPSYSVFPDVTSVNEGSSVVFTINTINVPDATDLYWSLGSVSGTVTTNDFTSSTGTVTINNNTASVSINVSADALTEGVEEFLLQVKTDSQSGTVVATSASVTINDTSLTPAYTATTSAAEIAEGETVTITVNTTNVPDGTSLNWVSSTSSLEINPSGGTLTINNNTGSFTITANKDLDIETNQTVTITVIDPALGNVIATTSFVITDTVFTIAAVASTYLIVENATVTVTVTTTDVPDGSQVQIAPTSSAAFDVQPSSIIVTINNNTGSYDFTTVRDGLTEGSEIFRFNIRNTEGDILTQTNEITIVDSSYTGKNFSNKTFGPISVNRDGGNAAAASDWYDICNIDSIPDGSEIAVFIDGSGSMTQSTIQASLDLLQQRLQSRNITITTVTNGNEDWITPFDTNTI